MQATLPFLILFTVALSSCAKLGIGDGETKITQEETPFGGGGIPPTLRSAGSSDAGTPVTAGGNVTAAPQKLNLTPEEEIVFTDPDNPEASLPELSTLLSNAPKRKGPWEDSETIARQRAAREGKPLLIWFTDSSRSPMCKAINQELFSTPEFESWASEKLVRLRVDANIQVNDPDISLAEKDARYLAMKNYVARMKKTYKVLGHPTLVLLNPGGEVLGKYRGYQRGESDYKWGLIRQGEAASVNAYQEWKKSLEKKGYREWTDRKDRKVFAKLTSYSKGTLTLIEPDGTRSRTHEDKLSNSDQAWIAEQKKLRGLE